MPIFQGVYREEERLLLIKREKNRIRKIFKELQPDRKKLAEKLIENAAFSAVMLDEASKIIARDGIVEEYQNGANQQGVKKSSAVEVYDKALNTYSKIIKQLCDMLPEEAAADPAEELLKFVSSG